MKGRKPTPAFLKIVKGNPGKRPVNEHEPTSPEIGAAPAHLSPVVRETWAELVASAPVGVLKRADAALVELTARLLAQSRAAAEVAPVLATQLRACFAELGLTPTSRARLSVAPPKSQSAFDEL